MTLIYNSGMNWRILTKDVDPADPVTKRLFDEAIEAAPAGFVRTNTQGDIVPENTIAMLPRYPTYGRCRLCGNEDNLTKEHIPPKSSGNKERLATLTFDDWTQHPFDIKLDSHHKKEQGGDIWLYYLSSM